ncbi:MAG: hypothetical protein ABWY93_11785 [Mycobacterium sp.]
MTTTPTGPRPPGTTPPTLGDHPPNDNPRTSTTDDGQPYVLVWNDPVDLKQLSVSIVVCSVLSLTTFLLAKTFIGRVVSTDSLTGGYALLAGLVACVGAAAICAKLFAPKRTFTDEGDDRRSTAVAELEAMGGTTELFDHLPETVKAEMTELGLTPVSTTPNAETRP